MNITALQLHEMGLLLEGTGHDEIVAALGIAEREIERLDAFVGANAEIIARLQEQVRVLDCAARLHSDRASIHGETVAEQRKEIARLQDSNERLNAGCVAWFELHKKDRAKIVEQQREIERLKASLSKYGGHTGNCHPYDGNECFCGYREALR